MTIDFNPDYKNIKKVPDEPARIINLHEEKNVEFEDVVHFNGQTGFHLKDKSGQYVYPLGGIIQNIIASVVMQLVNKT